MKSVYYPSRDQSHPKKRVMIIFRLNENPINAENHDYANAKLQSQALSRVIVMIIIIVIAAHLKGTINSLPRTKEITTTTTTN